MDAYDLGILWATCSRIGDKYIIRNEDPYFAQWLLSINGGTIWTQCHARNNTILHCLVIKRLLWEELEASGYTGRSDSTRKFPTTKDDSEFVRAYIQCHGVLDLRSHKTRQGTKISTPRFRIHGAPDLIGPMSEMITFSAGTGNKSLQMHSNGKMGIFYYQSPDEVIKICDWIMSGEHSPRFAARREEVIKS